MFVLAEFEDLVKIEPSKFKDALHNSISEALNKKLANKVVLNVGLCIVLYDILDIGDSFVFPGDGAHHTKVKYRFVVFRPYMYELLTGKVKSCSSEGVQITLGFFDDILIPASYLQHPSKFNEDEQLWIWDYELEGKKHALYMDIGHDIRFRIISESFTETSPEECDKKTASTNKVPYNLMGSCAEAGLGIMKWWTGL